MRKRKKALLLILASLVIIGTLTVFSINSYIKTSVRGRILTMEEAHAESNVDCILVLGCGVWKGGIPTPMLADRLEQSIELYQGGVPGKLLMSGDHGQKEYDEVNVMKDYAINAGIPSGDIFMDHAGFSTYESIYRARDIFLAKKVIIVTQGYHIYRALHIAKRLGLEAYGVCADQQIYAGQEYREAREILARVKDFFTALYKPKPTYLGETIPVSGDGDLTND